MTFLLILLFSMTSHALFTEVGLSHSFKRTTFSTDNYVESETSTASVSFYIWEKIALETSFSNGIAIRKEKDTVNPIRTITQYSQVYGMDLIIGMNDRKAVFQPFIKGGAAYIKKKQVVQDEGSPSFTIEPDAGVAPSYGVGFKLKLSEQLNFTGVADVWQTPLDDGTKTNDIATRLGFSWIF
jgi:hypothetical protein